MDVAGRVLGQSYAIVTQQRPQPGWLAYDPHEVWHRSWQALEHACRAAGIAPGELTALGVVSQRGTVVVWERETGRPIGPAVSRHCVRTTAICHELRAGGYEEVFRQRTGGRLDTTAAGPKIHWLLTHVPGLLRRAKQGEICCGTMDSWLLWNLTEGAVHATDWTNASATLLFNLERRDWDEELLDILGIPQDVLPQVCPSGYPYGQLRSGKTAITALCADQQAGLFGQACFRPGAVHVSYGRSAVALMEIGEEPLNAEGELSTVAAPHLEGESPRFALEGHVLTAGMVVEWLRDELALIPTVADSALLAGQVQDSGGLYLVPAFQGLGSPYWNPQVRGGLTGLTTSTSRGQLVRAALEGVAYRLRDVIEAMAHWTGRAPLEVRADGGAAANDFLMQFQADILGLPVLRGRLTEAAGPGAAYLAGLQTGLWASREAIAALWPLEHRFEPEMDERTRRLLYRGWQQALHRLIQSPRESEPVASRGGGAGEA